MSVNIDRAKWATDFLDLIISSSSVGDLTSVDIALLWYSILLEIWSPLKRDLDSLGPTTVLCIIFIFQW